MRDIKEVFTSVYEKNVWGSKETRSGKGSEIKATTKVVKAFPAIFEKNEIIGLVDIGCGECNWVQQLFPKLAFYLGIDVVEKIIEENNKKYNPSGRRFCKFANTEFPYWMADLYDPGKFQAILFADVLVHLPNHVVQQYLNAIKDTEIQYIFATTFPEIKENTDVELNEIAWRPINMAIDPFNLGVPIEMLKYNEFYVCETGDKIKKKYIGLWKIN
jgi:2-polyprenyl-3-methyl-5-hydroxy-6-metoxy-1,4-benzoquinol methylase